MHSTLSVVAVAAILAGSAVAVPAVHHHNLVINTPVEAAVVTCEPILITWSGGSPPYFLSAVTPGDTSTLEYLISDTTQTSFSYELKLAAGTEFEFLVKDSTGVQAFTGELVVQGNPVYTC